jgi:hypothetical protein
MEKRERTFIEQKVFDTPEKAAYYEGFLAGREDALEEASAAKRKAQALLRRLEGVYEALTPLLVTREDVRDVLRELEREVK